MLAIQAPPATALISPARRDSPRPAATVRSASGPRPKIRRLPSGMPTTSPDGVLTRAATAEVGWLSMASLPVGERSAGYRAGVGRRMRDSRGLTAGHQRNGQLARV